MIRQSKKDALLDAAIKSYAENGEQGLTTKNLAKVAGCSEALIYRHFKSKDDLLCACYLRLHKRANASFEPIVIPESASITDIAKVTMDYWMKVFTFFVDAGYESMFYFWFRMSDVYLELLKEGSEDVANAHTTSFMNMFESLRAKLDLNISAGYFRTYMVFAMGMFVSQVVTGKMAKTEESYNSIRNLVFGGIMTTLPGVTIEKIAGIGNR